MNSIKSSIIYELWFQCYSSPSTGTVDCFVVLMLAATPLGNTFITSCTTTCQLNPLSYYWTGHTIHFSNYYYNHHHNHIRKGSIVWLFYTCCSNSNSNSRPIFFVIVVQERIFCKRELFVQLWQHWLELTFIHSAHLTDMACISNRGCWY